MPLTFDDRTLGILETKLVEMTLPEDKVLEKLNAVATAKRLANMVSRKKRQLYLIAPDGFASR